jgi:hypothetical protein
LQGGHGGGCRSTCAMAGQYISMAFSVSLLHPLATVVFG